MRGLWATLYGGLSEVEDSYYNNDHEDRVIVETHMVENSELKERELEIRERELAIREKELETERLKLLVSILQFNKDNKQGIVFDNKNIEK